MLASLPFIALIQGHFYEQGEVWRRSFSAGGEPATAGTVRSRPREKERHSGCRRRYSVIAEALSTGELLLEVRHNLPAVSIVMFGMDADQEKFLTAVHHGVTGYVLKDASAADVAGAIRAVSNGESVCPPTLCRALFDHVAGSEAWRPGVQVRQNLGLTRREQQLVQLLSEGLTNKEIAATFNLAEQTVKNHVRRMLRKVGATDRLEAIERCRELGFWT